MSFNRQKSRTWVEVDYGAIRENYLAVKKRVGDSIGVIAIVKSDAYGHGAVEVAAALGDDADFYGVACIDEAIELRESGVKCPILILGYTDDSLSAELVEYGIHPAIFGYSEAVALSEAAKSQGREAHCFIALDTGMNRIGFRTYNTEKSSRDESAAEIAKIAALPNLTIDGIFSHFYASDSTDKTSAMLQKRRFVEFDKLLKSRGVTYKWRSLYNSPAIADLPLDSAFELVREGIMLYGLKTTDGGNVNGIVTKPAMSFYSRVTYVKEIAADEGVSYGHTYKTDAPRVIATVAAGYADGVPRLLSNRGRVIVGGHFAPIVGRVCMDQLMVDLTDVPGVKRGDVVTLIGTSGGLTIEADEVAKLCGTIDYEIVCGLVRGRVPRIAVGNLSKSLD